MKKLNILVGDDTSMMLDVAKIDFKAHNVVTAKTGEELVEKALNEGPFDLILTDWNYGTGINGIQAVRKIREQNYTGVIWLHSGELSDDILADAWGLSINRTIPKPHELLNPLLLEDFPEIKSA
jgi:CheY-like chemotaxis protein